MGSWDLARGVQFLTLSVCNFWISEFLEQQVWVCRQNDDVPPLMCIIGKNDTQPTKDRDVLVVLVSVKRHPDAEKVGWRSVAHVTLLEDAFARQRLNPRTGQWTNPSWI